MIASFMPTHTWVAVIFQAVALIISDNSKEIALSSLVLSRRHGIGPHVLQGLSRGAKACVCLPTKCFLSITQEVRPGLKFYLLVSQVISFIQNFDCIVLDPLNSVGGHVNLLFSFDSGTSILRKQTPQIKQNNLLSFPLYTTDIYKLIHCTRGSSVTKSHTLSISVL